MWFIRSCSSCPTEGQGRRVGRLAVQRDELTEDQEGRSGGAALSNWVGQSRRAAVPLRPSPLRYVKFRASSHSHKPMTAKRGENAMKHPTQAAPSFRQETGQARHRLALRLCLVALPAALATLVLFLAMDRFIGVDTVTFDERPRVTLQGITPSEPEPLEVRSSRTSPERIEALKPPPPPAMRLDRGEPGRIAPAI